MLTDYPSIRPLLKSGCSILDNSPFIAHSFESGTFSQQLAAEVGKKEPGLIR